jgi:predicted nucleotidyltransferase
MFDANTKVKFNQTGPWTERAILFAQAGSSAYGTRMPDSDQDYRGVFLATREQVFGLQKCEVHTETDPHDLQMFELRHFASLCLKGSPGQIEMLFYQEEVIIGDSDEFRRLWDIRHLFLSKRLKGTLGGFAQSDLKRIAADNTGKSGAKGKALIAKFGYNTKHAANAYRLLKMSEILFTTGELIPRMDEKVREEIKAIKHGKYKKDEFLAWVMGEDQRIFELAEKSSLPAHPDFHAIEGTVMDIYQNASY